MSFFGNILGGYGASQFGKYNAAVTVQQAKIDAAKAEVREKIYQNIERPNLIKDLGKPIIPAPPIISPINAILINFS